MKSLGRWLYTLGLLLFFLGMSPLVLWQFVRHAKYRRGLGERLGRMAAWEGTAGPLWLHTVSVGEAMAAAPLACELRRRRPKIPLLVSTVTETGRAVAEQRLPADRYVFFPFDFPWTVLRALDRLRPRIVLLTETELWPNLLWACARRKVPVVVVNGRISPRSFPRYLRVRPWFRQVLRDVTLFCMQSQVDAERILTLGAPPERVRIVGNLKYDLADLGEGGETAPIRRGLGLTADVPLLVGGSTHRGEEEAVLAAFGRAREAIPSVCLLLAPRHPERLDEVERLVRQAGHRCLRRSRLPAEPLPPGGVILLDTMGELARLYAAASVVFIGGSLIPHGGQNLLEPAAHARPVIHGPHMGNFAEMRKQFLEAGAAVEIPDGTALPAEVLRLLCAPALADRMGKAGRRIVESHRGATRRTADLVERLL
ncbi:MAG: 3-deoxy-D-manno-octulosonic acid transferase [candidate division NC10 bacterium]|nr:3-deoxy-D-manno-octulosonic acid transferase [candidate division NC10 bacterium]